MTPTAERPRRSRIPAIPDTRAAGIGLALVTAAISGLSIFVNATAVKQVPDPALFTTLKNGVAALLLVVVAFAAVRPSAVRALRPRSWAGLLAVGIVGGSIPFLLFFTGLAEASAPSAAFIHKTLFVWVAALAVPLLGERLGWLQIVALGVLLGGQLLATPPTGVTWGRGETLIAGATLLWSVEVVLARRLLTAVPSPVLAAGRLGVGLVVLVGYLAVTGRLGLLGTLTLAQWAWALGTGVLLAGYVGTWFGALRRAPATIVTSVLVVGAPITALLQAGTAGTMPAASAAIGYALIATAAAVLAVQTLRPDAPRLVAA